MPRLATARPPESNKEIHFLRYRYHLDSLQFFIFLSICEEILEPITEEVVLPPPPVGLVWLHVALFLRQRCSPA
jgi:hypothetical protein